jgi:hypothetical protein
VTGLVAIAVGSGLAVGGALSGLVRAMIGEMANEEAQTRLGRIPRALIRLALHRVPVDLRDDLAAEWDSELGFVLVGTEGLPLTRLLRGTTFAVGIFWSAGAIAAGFGTVSRRRAHPAVALALFAVFVWLISAVPPATIMPTPSSPLQPMSRVHSSKPSRVRFSGNCPGRVRCRPA